MIRTTKGMNNIVTIHGLEVTNGIALSVIIAKKFVSVFHAFALRLIYLKKITLVLSKRAIGSLR